MTAIARQSAKIFAQNAPVGQVTAFRTTESTPQTTKAPDQIQNENYLQGWLNSDGSGNVLPYAEDMNGLFYTLSYNTAYLYEKGIPEYSSTQTYYLNSFCQYSGTIYRCKGDSVINIAPTNTNYWDALPSSSYTATTVGAASSNYGTVYAGTDTAGTQFQFKTIIGGSNVTISETADSLTISSTGGGGGTAITASAPLDLTNNVLSIPAATSSQAGYLTAADWTSFNSKLSSTIFSSSNTWTASNNFSDILPRANNTYTLGSESYAWLEVYTNYLLSNANDHLVIGNTTDNNRVLVNYVSSGSNWGIFPDTISGTDSYLGNSSYRWNYAYIYNIYSNNIAPIATSGNLGTENNYWSNVYLERIRGGSGTNNIVCYKNFIPSSTTPTETLGNTTYSWASTYTSAVGSNSDTLTVFGSGNASATNFFLKPQNNATNRYLGGSSSNDHWTVGYINKLYLGAGSSNGLYLGADDSHSYVKDVTANTLQLHATSSIQFQTNISGAITGRCQIGNTEFRPMVTDNSYNLGDSTHRWGTIYYNTMVPPSDSRYKDNIENLESGLKTINDMTIKAYTYKHNRDHIEYGIIAQDMADKYPELVSVPTTEDEPYGIYLHNFIFVALRAIQELSAKVDDLQQQLQELKK